MKGGNWRIEGTLWCLAFLDLLGFGMLIPNVQLQAERMGTPGWGIGAILSSMFVVQFLVSSSWGRLSDRIGRKPVIVVCTLLSASAMAVYAMADTPWLILASRVLAGLGAANIAVAQAYCSDLAATGSKVAAMGRMGAAISAGLIAGPAVGGAVGHWGGHGAVGWVAATASSIGAVLAWALLPRVPVTPRSEKPKGSLDLLAKIPGLGKVFGVIAIGWLSLATLEGTFGRLIKHTLGLGELEFGLVFGYESLLGLIVQGLLVGAISRKWSPTVALRLSYVQMGLGLGLFAFAPSLAVIFLASTIYAVGSSIANPTANALCSELTPEDRQGELFGLMQSARSFGFLIGPVLGGALFDAWYAGPYVLAMFVCLVAALAVPSVSPRASSDPAS